MNNLVFDRVDSSEKLLKWEEFSKSFDHDTKTPMTPIVNVSRRENDGSLRQFGFYTLLTHNIVFPSYHPKHCTPRDFHDMTCAFSNAACLGSISPQYPNGCCFVGLVSHGLPVSRNIVSKLGFENLNIELHRRLP